MTAKDEAQGILQANRLVREKSPYLLQHSYNPVDWYPWGPEAFACAKETNRPIFLSIGYSTCHWCHVMERESFTNEEIARFLNTHFVCIKVDREERPDLDRLYMTYVQATTGQGGWPMTVFLTPDLLPFFGGTYFPPASRQGQQGLLDVLQEVQRLWMLHGPEVLQSAEETLRLLRIATTEADTAHAQPLSPQVLHAACARLKNAYDPQYGGFGRAPKFPQPSRLLFLLRQGITTEDHEALQMVFHTCQRMAAGGIHDQLGGGFSRYATDRQWLVPHFEKMLYDNALLAQVYLEASQAGGPAAFSGVARDILDYVRRDMTGPDGEFYSAEDADSEGHEGRFYCWTRKELAAILTPEELDVATHYFGVTPQGNFVDVSDPSPLPGQNVLSIHDPALPYSEKNILADARGKMTNARALRPRPHRDDKVLASWNGLMLDAMAQAYSVLGEPAYLEAARRNLAFLHGRLWDPDTCTLCHRWRDGERDAVQLLNAYACVLSGAVQLYEALLDPQILSFAIELADAMITRFHDAEHGGFWQTPLDTTDLILRTKEESDGAEPSGSAVAILALLRMAVITGHNDYERIAARAIRIHTERLQHNPETLPHLLLGTALWLASPTRVTIAGDVASPAGRALIRAAHADYHPFRIVAGTAGPVDSFARGLPAVNGEPTAYVCIGTVCRPPTCDSTKLRRLLATMPSQAADYVYLASA